MSGEGQMFGHQLLQCLVYFTQAYLSLAQYGNALSTRPSTGASATLLLLLHRLVAFRCIVSVNHCVVSILDNNA